MTPSAMLLLLEWGRKNSKEKQEEFAMFYYKKIATQAPDVIVTSKGMSAIIKSFEK